MDETKNTDRGLKEAAAQLSSSITKVSTLPKNVQKAMDTTETKEKVNGSLWRWMVDGRKENCKAMHTCGGCWTFEIQRYECCHATERCWDVTSSFQEEALTEMELECGQGQELPLLHPR